MKAKTVQGLSNSDYHSDPAISKSGLDEINKSPKHYWEKYLKVDRDPVVWTDAFTVGSVLHALVLEPQNYDNDFITLPEIDKRTKAGKEEFKSFEDKAKGKILVTPKQLELCEIMTKSIEEHPKASEYLDGFGTAELSIFFEWDGVKCRCRPDYIREDGVVVDVKTAQTAHPTVWPKKAYDLRYHVQTAFYSEGYRQAFGEMPKAFVFVVVEKMPPYGVTVFKATDELFHAGMIDTVANLRTYRECLEKNEWPGYANDKELEFEIPGYAKKKYEDPK